ncbi:MAG: hypothetical protein AAF494_05525 [Pseudomonadota bacterium]
MSGDRQIFEHSLDPSDRDADRAVAQRVLDDMFDDLQTARARPVWQPVHDAVRARLESALPQKGAPLDEVVRHARVWLDQNSAPLAAQ